jgi:hypothetical protein
MLELGRCRGKAVAVRWRATGGAGHNATTKGLTGLSAGRKVGRLGRCPGRQNPWLDAVAAVGGISGEVSLAVAADDEVGTCILHVPVFLEDEWAERL